MYNHCLHSTTLSSKYSSLSVTNLVYLCIIHLWSPCISAISLEQYHWTWNVLPMLEISSCFQVLAHHGTSITRYIWHQSVLLHWCSCGLCIFRHAACQSLIRGSNKVAGMSCVWHCPSSCSHLSIDNFSAYYKSYQNYRNLINWHIRNNTKS